MNIKQIIVPISMIIIGITQHSFSMNTRAIVKAAILPVSGGIISAKNYWEYKQDLTKIIAEHRWPEPAILWIEKIKYDAGIKLPTEYVYFNKSDSHSSGFCTTQDRIIVGDGTTVERINHLVQQENKTDNDHAELASHSVFIKHELGHVKGNDSWKKIKASFIIPTAIQAGCSGIHYCFDKIFTSKNFSIKTNTNFSSAATLLALWMKITVWDISEKTYYRYLEKNADQFALEHATPQEIAAFIKMIKKNEQEMLQHPDYKDIVHDETEMRKTFFFGKDPHTFPADRIAMAEKHLKKTEQSID